MNILDSQNFNNKFQQYNSTKELYRYAKNKIIKYAKEQNKEFLIIADTQKNKILFEKAGDENSVDIKEFKFPSKGKNIVLMHGHTTNKGSPLSLEDCLFLCKENFEKIIAFNKKGKFSLLQKKPNSNIKEAQKFLRYGIFFKDNPYVPQNGIKKWLIIIFGNSLKYYEKWIKKVVEHPNINFRYVSSMFKK